MKLSENHLESCYISIFFFDWDTSPIVSHLIGAIGVKNNIYKLGMACGGLVDAIVNDLPQEMG